MSELIGGKEALIALANGKEVLIRSRHWDNFDDLTQDFSLNVFFMDEYEFKLKPRTITINGIEVPAPFEPKEGERFYYFSDEYTTGYASAERTGFYGDMRLGAWSTEEEIKQVVAALRSIFK